MTIGESLAPFLAACRQAGIATDTIDPRLLAPAVVIRSRLDEWRPFAEAAKTAGMRWSALWVREAEEGFEAFSCLERGGTYVVLRCRFPQDAALPSIAPVFAAADRPERHAHDLLGVVFADQPDNRRWIRHKAWGEKEFPLRSDYAGQPPAGGTPPDSDYPFAAAHGPGVIEIPVGPVHAGIIEPGHFRFQAMGEIIINLEKHLGYVHKGIEKIAVGRDAAGLARLAARVSGDSTVAHAWAACQALERAAGLAVPERGLWLRAILAERERIANHLGDIAGICNDVAFAFAYYQLTRLRERVLRENAQLFGHRLLMDHVLPGGTAVDIDAAAAQAMAGSIRDIGREAAQIVRMLEDSESLEDRLMRTGRLLPEQAAELGAVGYVGRASGQDYDVRRDAPYAPYDRLEVRAPHYRAGDVAARARVRADEIAISADLIARLVETLPPGPHRAEWIAPAQACEGIGIIDGWRGEIVTYVALDDAGRVTRFYPRDPSWLNWPALELLVQENIVPDFPVCNKSVNGSYSGHDL